MEIDEKLIELGEPTARQLEFLRAYAEHGSLKKAGEATRASPGNVSDAIRIVSERAARKGYAAGHWDSGVAPGYVMGKVTIERRNADGTKRWERQSPELAVQLAAIKAAVAAFCEGVGDVHVAPKVDNRATDIIPWINIGDAHFGMLAHEAETGANFDLKIAERELCAAISILVDEMIEHDRVVINDLGDFTHYENMAAETEASGHRLDADGRFPKMISVYSRVMRFIVEKVLEKANVVDVIVNQGNHSRTNDIWMAELLRVAFGHTGRVNVLNNDGVFIGYRMGNTLVMTHHSDKCKPNRLASVMTCDFRQDYGETEYHYIDIGHIHHGMVMKEHPDIHVESFNTLAAKDQWAAYGGYRSRQSITVIHRSRSYGEVGRRVLPIREVRDRIEAAMKRSGKKVYRPTENRAFAV